MVNIIIVDDNQGWLSHLKSKLEKILFPLDYSFKIHTFSSFDDQLKDYILNNDNFLNIYILDIVLKKHSGLSIASFIRNKADDWNSFILFNTSFYQKYQEKIYQGQYGFLRFIQKESKSYYLELEDSIKYAIKSSEQNKSLCLKKQNMFYRFYTNDILYIEYINRKSKIYTNYTSVSFNVSLLELKSMLNDNFLYSHKSCLVNIKRIKKINKKEKIIYFDDGSETNLVSLKYLKEILKHFEQGN